MVMLVCDNVAVWLCWSVIMLLCGFEVSCLCVNVVSFLMWF